MPKSVGNLTPTLASHNTVTVTERQLFGFLGPNTSNLAKVAKVYNNENDIETKQKQTFFSNNSP